MTDRDPNQLDEAALAAFSARAGDGPVRMLNLLAFRPGGDEVYRRYAEATRPLVERVGGRMVLAGRPAECLIGEARWDLMLVVEYPTRGALLAMIRSEEYQQVAPLRAEAVARSVLYALDPPGF